MRVLLLLLVTGIFPLCLQSQTTDTFLVKPYLQWATLNSITILWETHTPRTGKLHYGKARPKAEEVVFDHTIDITEPKLLHEVRLNGLDTAEKYLYQVESVGPKGSLIKSEIATFKTNVRADDAFFFTLVGDSQHSSSSSGKWGKIASLVWQERPNFIIHAGDLVDVGTRKSDWTEYFFPLGHIAMKRFPMYAVLGNHEQDADYYYDYMVSPAPEYYYTFHYGNAQFFMIDSNRDVSEGSEQYDWLEWELSKSRATWKFVVHHHPPYSSEENDHGDTYLGASSYGTHTRNLTPLYDAYGVDFCLFGHTHVYERSWPLNNNRINQKDGVIYINSGGAGGGLEDFDPVRSWFTKELETGHHYCTFAVHDHTLSFKAIDEFGRLFDQFSLEKEANGQGMSISVPPAPHFEIDHQIFQNKASARLIPINNEMEIRYTLDGSEPGQKSQKYTDPIRIEKSCVLKARCYNKDGRASRIVERGFRKMQPQAASNVKTEKGLSYKYYEGKWNYLPDFSKLEVVKAGVVQTASIEKVPHRDNNFGVVLEGYLEVPETATYTLYTYSDDGSKLYLNDELLIDSDGRHSAKYVYGTTILEKGKHKLRIEYFEGAGNNFVYTGFVRGDNDRIPFSPFELSH